MDVALVLTSALLHALWNAILRKERDKDVAGVAVVGAATLAASLTAAVSWLVTREPPFPGSGAIGWSVGAGLFESVYFLLLVRALERAPVAVAYTASRGIAVLAVWPISHLWLGEPITGLTVAGTALLCLGLVATCMRSSGPAPSTGAFLPSALCGLAIAGYHLCYKQAMATGARPAAVFALALAVALPLNLSRLGRERWSILARQLRTRLAVLLVLGAICAASFLLLLASLDTGGAAFVLVLRNTSIVFATLIAWVLAEPPSRPQLLGCVLVTAGAILVGLSR